MEEAPTPEPVLEASPPPDGDKQYYSVVDLRNQAIPGLDYKNRETYLHPDDFHKIFNVNIAEFNKLPNWKQTQMKRKARLF